jgi:hypothetical protein
VITQPFDITSGLDLTFNSKQTSDQLALLINPKKEKLYSVIRVVNRSLNSILSTHETNYPNMQIIKKLSRHQIRKYHLLIHFGDIRRDIITQDFRSQISKYKIYYTKFLWII